VILFSVVPFNVAIPVGVKSGGEALWTTTVATMPDRRPDAVGGLDSKSLMHELGLEDMYD
jgi:hypothetical protein